MKKLSLLAAIAMLLSANYSANATVWRVNNNLGASANFNNLSTAVSSATVVNGDTLYIEASATNYYDVTISKQLTFIGTGYFIDTASTAPPANTGLQYNTQSSLVRSFNLVAGSNGCRFIGLTFTGGSIYGAVFTNITFEKCMITESFSVPNATNDGLVIRKCYINNQISCTQGSLINFTCENNIFADFWGSVNLPNLIGSNNIFRNNSFAVSPTVYGGTTIANCYVANNIFTNGNGTPVTFTDCTIKNNLFSQNQTLPGTAANNQINVNMANVYVGGTTSYDSRLVLKAGSPAIGAGVTVGSVTTPDCGAFGATDPYKLSGIPGIPAIYNLTAPASIPSGTATMNVTFSTRSNN